MAATHLPSACRQEQGFAINLRIIKCKQQKHRRWCTWPAAAYRNIDHDKIQRHGFVARQVARSASLEPLQALAVSDIANLKQPVEMF
jgi:hypothetical protein